MLSCNVVILVTVLKKVRPILTKLRPTLTKLRPALALLSSTS